MVRPGDRYRVWSRRCWGLAAIFIAASLGPMVYCMGWSEVAAAGEATVGYCLDVHLLQFPVTILVSGLFLVVGGVMLRINAGQVDEEARRHERKMDRAAQRVAERQPAHTPQLGEQGLRGAGQAVPDEIEVDEEFDLSFGDGSDAGGDEGEDDTNSMMAFLQAEQQARALRREDDDETPRATADGQYYVPPGLEDAPVLYVEADVEPTPVVDGTRRVDNPNLPHDDISEALRHAFRVVMKHETEVLVRVKPGVYQGAVEIPDRVTVMNHRLPASSTVDQRVAWLREQTEIDHPERVTLLAPGDSEFGVRVKPGRMQGLFGCHLVGRSGVVQTGLRARDNAALAVVHCRFESFSDSGAHVVDSGEDLPGRRVQFVGCVWRSNRAREAGGGLRVERSSVRVEASIFDGNRAPRGGAVAVSETEDPLIVERSLLQRNRALTDDVPGRVRAMSLKSWQKADGVGGGLLVRGGLARIKDTLIEGNDAAIGGGGIAAMGARVVVASSGEDRGVCRGNRADTGGGVLAVGWLENPAMIRAKNVEMEQNLAKSSGGAAAAVGNAVLHIEKGRIETNRAAGDEHGIGGGIAAWCAAGVQVLGTDVASNRSTGGGGGIGAFNASVKLAEGCVVHDNRADRNTGGGGVLVVTGEDRNLGSLIGQQGFSIPFKLKLEDVRIRANHAGGPGGGVRAGNIIDETTFPLAIKIERPTWITNNEADGDRDRAQNIWIEWAGRTVVDDDAGGAVKQVLK